MGPLLCHLPESWLTPPTQVGAPNRPAVGPSPAAARSAHRRGQGGRLSGEARVRLGRAGRGERGRPAMGHRVVSAQQYPRIPLIARQLRSRRFPGPGLRALVARASNPPASAKYRGIGAAALTRDRVQWPQIRAQRLQEAFWRAEGGVGPLAGFPVHKSISGAARREPLTPKALHCPAPPS